VSAVLTRLGLGWLEAVVFLVPLFLVYGFICLSAWYVCRAQPVRSLSLPRLMLSSSAAALVAASLWLAKARVWTLMLGATETFGASSDRLDQQLPLLFALGILLYLLSIAAHYALLAIDAAREAERHQLELEVLAREAELRALRAQINPHFLYNSLNSISALTMRDPAGARRMCVLLGDFLRSTLNVSGHNSIRLSEELALVDRFLNIEQVRFGTRLQVTREIDDDALACLVPPLMLQPLVENAVVHGVASRLDGGSIHIRISHTGDTVTLVVDNTRDADASDDFRAGVGLDNVRRRLDAMFGNQARLTATAAHETFRVSIVIPWTTHD
jgi:two-component system, LytTR family, sensor histidine kinase AlgZ